MALKFKQIILCALLFVITISEAREQSYGRRTVDADDPQRHTIEGDTRETNTKKPLSGSVGEKPDQLFSQGSSGKWNIGDNEKSTSQSSGSFSNNREGEYSQRPNQQWSSENSGQLDNRRPSSGSSGSFTNNNRESEYNQRPNQQWSSGNSGQSGNHRPSSGSSGSFTNNNRESEYNQRPNQQWSSGNSGQSGNHRPSSGSSGSFTNNNRESEYNQRPNQQWSSGNSGQSGNHRPSSGSSGSFTNNNRESEYNQRPNQQWSSGNSGQSGNHRPSSGSSGSFTNNNENIRPNQPHTGNAQRPGQYQSSQNSHQFSNEYNQRPSSTTPPSKGQDQRPSSQSGTESSGEKELCYKIFGCFSITEPWTSKLRPIPGPLPPENNSAVLYFYSRPQTNQRYLINLYPKFSLGEANFDARKPTAIIIHGFIQDGNELWMDEMKNAYLKHVDANVMIVDWGKGSRRLSYLQAAGNTRLIGTMISHLIKRLMQSHGANPGDFHLIGHSLGAQIASYAGKEVPGIGRLTALDPAQPGFEGFDKKVRLDKSDAEFVDVIHTNAKPFIPTFGLGMIKPYGHVDFYMNGGFDQPLCVSPAKNSLKEIKSIMDLANAPVDWFSQTFTCDHTRAHAYLTEAFNNTDCVFWGHKATAKTVAQGVANTLTQGLLSKYVALSTNCSKDDCIPMGFRTKESPLRGSFVVTTNGKFPYCMSDTEQKKENKSPNAKGSGKKKNS